MTSSFYFDRAQEIRQARIDQKRREEQSARTAREHEERLAWARQAELELR